MPQAGGVAVNAGMTKSFSSDEMHDELYGPDSEFAKAVKPLLTEAQIVRLRQLDLVSKGVAAFANRRVVRLLQLTEAQEDEIERIGKQFMKENRDVRFKPKELGEMQDAAMAACVKLLTPDQKKLWAACSGAPMPASELLTVTQSHLASAITTTK